MNTSALKEIEKILQNILKTMATKDDLKTELAKYATKDDLTAMKKELIDYISEGEVAIINGVEKHVIGRIEAIEHQLQQT
ncbi:MAG: hypothetical protein HYV37_03475 [Candidatus Levyibacteriota bacterium]|nr:MAG: hypothetical protein HYV37_03475 [Candidatus Levybacteria bacterium]